MDPNRYGDVNSQKILNPASSPDNMLKREADVAEQEKVGKTLEKVQDLLKVVQKFVNQTKNQQELSETFVGKHSQEIFELQSQLREDVTNAQNGLLSQKAKKFYGIVAEGLRDADSLDHARERKGDVISYDGNEIKDYRDLIGNYWQLSGDNSQEQKDESKEKLDRYREKLEWAVTRLQDWEKRVIQAKL